MGLIIGIDASRNRSGGAKAHLIGILTEGDPIKHGIREVHVWAYKTLLMELPDYPWLVKHGPPALDLSLFKQILWQATKLADEARSAKCDILFTTDASTVCYFRPMVVLSQDMLSYEPGIMCQFGYGIARLRLLVILVLQNMAFRRADGVIFLTKYAGKKIQQVCGLLPHVTHIPHGIGVEFRQALSAVEWPNVGLRSLRCLYVSNTAMYKHQWMVVRAIEELRKRGHDITLTLIGGGAGKALKRLAQQIAQSDPEGTFVQQLEFIPQKDLPVHFANSDIFVFASSCENMPVTLLEAMAAGLPIACSNRGPMPEVLDSGGVFFNPEDLETIILAIEQIIKDNKIRHNITQRAREISQKYSWYRCADKTWAFIVDTYKKLKP